MPHLTPACVVLLQANPKIMAALQDVQANGPGAMSKYANDPEIMSVVKELQSIIG